MCDVCHVLSSFLHLIALVPNHYLISIFRILSRASHRLVPDSSTVTTDVTGDDGLDTTTAYDDTESSITSVSQIGQRHRQQQQQRASRPHRPPRLPGPGIQGPPGAVPGTSASVVGGATTETSSMMSSEIESSVYDEDDDINSLASSSRYHQNLLIFNLN